VSRWWGVRVYGTKSEADRGGNRERHDRRAIDLKFSATLGLRRAFRLPEELRANWLFQFYENPATRDAQLNEVLKCFLPPGALPQLGICAPFEFIQFGPRAISIWLRSPRSCTPRPGICYGIGARSHSLWRRILADGISFQSVVVHIVELAAFSFTASEWTLAGLSQSVWFAVLAALMLGYSART
jgi:hypothetical protein